MGQSDRKEIPFCFFIRRRFGVADISLLTIRAELPASVEKSRERSSSTNVVCKLQAVDSSGPLVADHFGRVA
jgi:hypothetical protein